MSFPVDVKTTTVVETYLDAKGSPVKGVATFTPDFSAVGATVAVAPTPVRVTLDSTGSFSVTLAASVNTGLDPDIPYEVTLQLAGGKYSTRTFQIPFSATPIHLESLVPISPSPGRSRFIVPSRDSEPPNPQPGEMYNDTATGHIMAWNAVDEIWVDLSAGGSSGAPSGPAGGSLAGTYPNPTIKANAVDTAQLKDASVTAAKLSVSYVPTITYNGDLATTALALGDLQEQIDLRVPSILLNFGQSVPPSTAAGTLVFKKTS